MICKYCNRTFNLIAGERHEVHCKSTTHRPKKPPTMEEIEKRKNDRKSKQTKKKITNELNDYVDYPIS